MKKFNLLKKTILYPVLLVFCFAFILCGVFSLKTTNANAQTPNEIIVEDFLPLSDIEQLELSSPISVYHDDEVTAILEDAQKTIHVYKNGKYFEKTLETAQSVQKIERLGDDFVLFNGNNLYLVSIEDFENIELEDLYSRPITYNSQPVGCSNFDVWNDLVSVITGQSIYVYKVQGSYVTKLDDGNIRLTASQTPPITSNERGLYFIDSNRLVFKSYDSLDDTEPEVICENVNSSVLLANDDYLYYVSGNGVHRVDLNSKTDESLSYKKATVEDFELGSLTTISNLSFKDNNLLITDKDKKTIEEYKIENGNLMFTGFAIAKDKTAYNRVKNAKVVEYYGDNVAVLDDNKITVIKDGLADYSTDNFINFVLNGTKVTDICLGKDTLLAFYDTQVFAYDLKNNSAPEVVFSSSVEIYDVCYESGKFYVLSHDKNRPYPSFIQVISESDLSLAGDAIRLEGYSFTKIEVDLLGNFYFTDDENLYSFNGESVSEPIPLNDIKPSKITTDLSGKLFVSSLDGELYLYSENAFNEIPVNVFVKDFALSFEKRDVFIVDGTSEYLFKTQNLINSSFETLSLPEDYSVNASTTTLDKLSFVSVKEGANVFGYSLDDDKILFNGLKEVESEYLVISEILDANSSEKFYMLVGKDQTVMVNEKEATKIETPKLDAPKTVYVTTPVHAYYLPKITKTDDYVARLDGEKIFIELGNEIYPSCEISFNGTPFYLAKIIKGGVEYNLYVPKTFTSETIESATEIKTFTLRTMRPTTIYLDESLSNPLTETTENVKIRLYSIKDGVSEIEFFNGETWVKGFVRDKDILNEPNTAIRNVLIVLAVITCACGSITFFIIRNKRKD